MDVNELKSELIEDIGELYKDLTHAKIMLKRIEIAFNTLNAAQNAIESTAQLTTTQG